MNSQEREVFWQKLCSLKGNGEQDVQKLRQPTIFRFGGIMLRFVSR